MHQGEVWVESEVGVGSIFHILFPITQVPEEETGQPYSVSDTPTSDTPINGKQEAIERRPTILVVDDEPGVVDLYERYLRSRPYQILRANSGIEALQAIREYEGFIQLVLLDINMPGLNGWDVLKEMHDNPDIQDIPVIVCSIENDPVKALQLGARHSLQKPFVEDDLIFALQEVGLNE
jgi:CheY-like chemotaxis protein